MNPRQALILKALIQRYIDQAFPVSSKAIAQEFRYSFSPATIRNEMACLEKEGYLTHPYTSAGRIPTNKGYRYFISQLMEVRRPAPSFCRAIRRSLDNPRQLVKFIAARSRTLVIYFEGEQFFIQEGFYELLKQPEFSDRGLTLDFFDLVESLCRNPGNLMKALSRDYPQAFIGRQMEFFNTRVGSFGLVAGSLNRERSRILSLLGPSRMPYDVNLGMVEYITELFK
jgi:transcriptional regulator of heat shock response